MVQEILLRLQKVQWSTRSSRPKTVDSKVVLQTMCNAATISRHLKHHSSHRIDICTIMVLMGLSYLPTLLLGQDITQGQFLSGV